MYTIFRYYDRYFGGPMQGWQLLALILLAAIAVLEFCAWCRIFKKAGLPWERMFVPVYGAYWTYALAQGAGLFLTKLFLTVLFILSMYYAGNAIVLSPGVDWLWLLCVTGYAAGLLVIRFLRCARLAEAFAKGKGFTLGLFFLFPLYQALLAFTAVRYYGDEGVPTGRIELPAAWVCPYCGTANPERRDVCENCGRNVNHI